MLDLLPGDVLDDEGGGDHFELRAEEIDLLDLVRVEVNDYCPPVRGDLDEPFPFQHLEDFPYDRAADVEMDDQVPFYQVLPRLEIAGKDRVLKLPEHQRRAYAVLQVLCLCPART